MLFDSKLDHNSALHAKIREISLLIDSRIEFPDPLLMTLDRGKIIYSPLWFLILKLDHNSGLLAKIREKFLVLSLKASMVFRREKMQEKGGNYIRRKGISIKCPELSLLSQS